MNYLKYYLFVALFAILSFVCSCDISSDCTTTDDMEDFDTLSGMPEAAIYDSIFLLPHTLDTSVYVGKEYRIDVDTNYQTLLSVDTCPSCYLPPINWDTHTLIGKYLEEPCLGIYARKMIKVDEKHYRYLIKVIQDNRCVTASCPNFSFNFIVVPKLPADAEVTIEVGHSTTKCDC